MKVELPESFDEKLSNDVSLSKILDAFIVQNERPDIIMSFLDTYNDSFKSIIAYSLHWTRLFQLDFLLKCNDKGVDFLLKKLKSVPGSIAAYCCWQICKSESGSSQRMKFKFKKEMDWILSSFKTRHPYSTIAAKSVAQVDAKLFKACARDEFVAEVASLSDDEFSTLVNLSSCSIFKFRLHSLDVFLELSPIKQWIFMRNCNFFQSNYTETFLWQVLASDVDNEVKKVAVDCFGRDKMVNKEGDPYNAYLACSTYSEMMLKMTLDGNFNWQKMIEILLKYEKWKLLCQWAEQDPTTFNDVFKIGDVVQQKYMEVKAENKLKRMKNANG